MSRFGLAALAGLGSAAMGFPQGMDAAEKERLAQEDRLQRQQGIDLQRKSIERQESPVDVGALYDAIGLPRPADAPTSVDPRLASVYSQGILKRAEQDRKRRERADMAAAIRSLAPTASTPDSFGDVGGAMEPARTIQRPSRQRIAETLAPFESISPELIKLLTGDEGVKLQGFASDHDVYETTPSGQTRLVRPGTPKPTKMTEGDQKRAEIHNYLVNVRHLTPGTPQYEKEFMDWRNRPMTIFPGGGAFQMTDVVGGGGQPSAGPSQAPQPVATRPPTPPSVGAEQTVNLADYRTLLDQMDKVEQAYDPKFIGPVAGRVGALKGVTGLGATREEAGLRAALAQVQNSLIYLKSGKQINEQEYARLARELPDPNDPQPVFQAKLAASKSLMQQMLANREAEFTQRGFRGGVNVGPDAQNAAKPAAQGNAISRRDPRYQRARSAGLDDNAIMKKYGITLVD